jgi:transcriptional regulator with XRE-family HTH domain
MPTRRHDEALLTRIGARLQAARAARGMTQAQLAEAIHIEPVTLSRYETGARGASITVLDAAAQALGVSLADLVADDRPLPELQRDARVEQALRVLVGLDEERLGLALRVVEAFRR